MVRRVARGGAGDRPVHLGVAGDEQVGPPVAVHVADGRAGVPAEGDDPRRAGALRERAVPVVPEQLVVRGGRDVEVGEAVAVQVGGDAALSSHREACPRRAGDVHEPPVVVAEQCAARQAAVLVPCADVGLGVVVHDEQVEPAVVVVVEPAEPAAHHRRRVGRDAEAEGALPEIEADLLRDVRQANAGEACRRRPLRRGAGLRRGRQCNRPAAADVRNEPAAPVLLELERLAEAHRRVAPHYARRHVLVGGQLPSPPEGGDRDCRALAVAGLEPDAHRVETICGDGDRAACRRADLSAQRGQLVADRHAGERRRAALRQRHGLEAQGGDEVTGDPARRLSVEHGLHALRRKDRDLRQTAGLGERGGRRVRPGADSRRCDRPGVDHQRGRAGRDELRPAEPRERHVLEQRPCCGDDRERAEDGDLAPELGPCGGDQKGGQQADRDGVDERARVYWRGSSSGR